MNDREPLISTTDVSALHARIERLEEIVLTLTAWAVSAQTGLGKRDYEGIAELVCESRAAVLSTEGDTP